MTLEADGKTSTGSYSARFDGKDYPAKATNFDTIALKRIDNYSWENVTKRAGKVVGTGTNVVSKDGKTMTYTNKGITASGQSFTNLTVFEKHPTE